MESEDERSLNKKIRQYSEQIPSRVTQSIFYKSSENECVDDMSGPSEKTSCQRTDQLQDVGIVMSGPLELSIQGSSDDTTVTEKSPLCVLTETSMKFYQDSGEDLHDKPPYLSLTLQEDIKTIIAGPLKISINDSLVLTFQNNENYESWVVALKRLLPDKFQTELPKSLEEDNLAMHDIKPISPKIKKKQTTHEFDKNQSVKQSQIQRNLISQGDKDSKEEVPGKTHTNHKCPLTKCYEYYRQCNICNTNISDGIYSAKCAECNFELCIKCSSENRVEKSKALDVHQHPLIIHSSKERHKYAQYAKDNEFTCKICRISSEGISYMCNLCDFDACLACYDLIKPADSVADSLEETPTDFDTSLDFLKRVQSRPVADSSQQNSDDFEALEYKCVIDLRDTMEIYNWTIMNTYQMINEHGEIVQGVEFKDRMPPVVMPIKTWEEQQEAQCHNCYYCDIDIINWSMNRSCTRLYMVSIYQFGQQDAYSLILDIYHFDEGQKTPFSSARLSHLSQLVKPTKQYILKNSDSTQDVKYYTDRATLKILLRISDDEKYIVLFDRYTTEYHWLEVDSQNWTGNQEKATIEAFNRNIIQHPYSLKIDDIYLEGSFLYIKHQNSQFYKLQVPITDWSPAEDEDEVIEFLIDDFSLTQISDIIRLEYYDLIIYPDKLSIFDVISREMIEDANASSARFMEIYKCGGVVVRPDKGFHSIRKTQVDAFTQNDKEGAPSIIESFVISRIEQPSEDREISFDIDEEERCNVNLEHPLHPSEREEHQKHKLHYTLIAYHQKYYFFKVTGFGESIYIQKYLYDKENNEIDYISQIKIKESQFFSVPQLSSLPFYALDWKQFLPFNNQMEIVNTKEVRYVDMINKEQINNVGNIYYEQFLEKLFKDATEIELLGLQGATFLETSQIPQNDMILYFVNDEEDFFHGILLVQLQKQTMKFFKSQKKCKIVQQKTINRKDYFNLHLFLREKSREILQYVVKIDEESIEIYPSKSVCTEKMDLVGSFLSENAQTFSVIFSGHMTNKSDKVNASDLLNNIRGQPRKQEHQKSFSAFYQYTIDDDYADPGSMTEWKDQNNEQTIIIFQEDDEENRFTDKIAQIINKVARGYPVEVGANFQERFRQVMLKQFEIDEQNDYYIIAFKNKFILYKRYTSIAYFLNDGFHVQSILKFKNRIIKIQAMDSDYPDELEYINEDQSKCTLQIGSDTLFLPENLFFHENLITEHEIGSDYLSFFQSFQKRYSYQTLAILRLRKKQNEILDFVEKQGKEQLEEDSWREQKRRTDEKPKNNMELLLKEIRENDLDYILSFSLVTKQNIFTATMSYHDKDIIYEAIQNKLEISVVEELPLLIYNLEEDYQNYRSILDILIDNKAFTLTQLIISLALTQDKTGLMYDELTRYIDKLNFSMKDVKLYLESQICFRRISSEYYDELQANGDTIIFPCSDKDSIVDIVRDFKRIEAEMLGNEKLEAKGSKLNQIKTSSIDVSEMDSRLIEQNPLRRRESSKLEEEEEEEVTKQEKEYPIEYYVINLMKMKKAKQEVCDDESIIIMKTVSQKIDYTIQERKEVTDVLIKLAEKDQSVLEIETLQIIIEFKWKSYAQFFFTMQLILFTFYIISFIVDVVAISRNTKEFDTNSVNQITPRCICMSVLLILFAYEVIDLIKHPLAYFRQVWNRNDQFLFFVYTVFFTISFTKPQWLYALKILQLVIVISSFIKLTQLIRIWTKLSFMVKMLVTVFLELRYFLIFFLLVIGGLTVMIQIILKDSGENYEGIKFSAFFILALRQSIGDYDTSSLIDGTDNFKILAWLVWFLILIVGNVVFMNFIIAVVSESYENCMEKKIQSIQMAKLQMIQECESLLPEWCFRKEKWFPKFIIFRRQQDAECPDGENDQWQGFVKQIQHHFEQEVAIIRQQFKLERNRSEENKNLLKSSIAQNKSLMNEMNERTIKQISEVSSRVNTMEKKMDGLRDTLDDIKKMLMTIADKEK